MRENDKPTKARCGKTFPSGRAAQLGAFRLLRGKWKLQILLTLADGPIRLSDLQRSLQDVSKKVLLENLKALEKAKVVERRDLTTRIPYIEYRLKEPEGANLARIVTALKEWRPAEEQDWR